MRHGGRDHDAIHVRDHVGGDGKPEDDVAYARRAGENGGDSRACWAFCISQWGRLYRGACLNTNRALMTLQPGCCLRVLHAGGQIGSAMSGGAVLLFSVPGRYAGWYNKKKTAISINDGLLQEADETARLMGLSRSRLFALAVGEFCNERGANKCYAG